MKRLIASLLLLSFLPWSLLSQVPDGYTLVPIERLRLWSSELESIESSLRATEVSLSMSQQDTADLLLNVQSLTVEIENWRTKYQLLLDESEAWSRKYEVLNQELQKLEANFEKILSEYQKLEPELKKVSRKLETYRKATWGLTATAAALLVILIVDLVNN
jgi:chromosome segregation ATPase